MNSADVFIGFIYFLFIYLFYLFIFFFIVKRQATIEFHSRRGQRDDVSFRPFAICSVHHESN